MTQLALMVALTTALPQAPVDIRPKMVGQQVPDAQLLDVEGAPVQLAELLQERQTLLVVYRGGWCYFCNKQLGQLRHIQDRLDRLGYQIIAVSADAPKAMRASAMKNGLKYRLLSDPDLKLSRELGLVYQARTDPKRFDAPPGMGLPTLPLGDRRVEALPVPGVYLVSRGGRIHHEYVNVDYRVRLSAEVILTAARVYGEKSAD